MPGILRIAYKLLVNDRAKFAALLVGITLAVFLMIEMTSLFSGILSRSSATVINIGASIWVMDPAIQTVANTIPLPDYVLDEVRSMPGVKYAVPLYSGSALLKLRDGTYQAASILGLDDTSLFGRPSLIAGNIEDIFAESGFIAVKDSEFYKLENPQIGTEFELNDHRGVIVGIAEVASSGLFGVPTLYTTYNRALQCIPNHASPSLIFWLNRRRQPIWRRSSSWSRRLDTWPLPRMNLSRRFQISTNIRQDRNEHVLMTIISFVIGLSISGQTFYTFILENIDKFGALKAIGAKGRELVSMILFQATFVALTGTALASVCAPCLYGLLDFIFRIMRRSSRTPTLSSPSPW